VILALQDDAGVTGKILALPDTFGVTGIPIIQVSFHMRASTYFLAVGIVSSGCVIPLSWHGLKIEELPSYGDKKLRFMLDTEEAGRVSRQYGDFTSKSAHRYASDELSRRGMCASGIRGPDLVLVSANPRFTYFVIYCNEPADVKANNTFERAVGHRGRDVLAMNCALGGAEWMPCQAAQLGR